MVAVAMLIRPLAFVLAFGALACDKASAAVVINGDFETGSNLTFEGTPNWYNRGLGGQEADARSGSLNLAGSSFNAVISDAYDTANNTFGGLAHSQKTNYQILEGDYFQLTYQWRDAFNWQENRDVVRFVLFATDNDTLAGNVAWTTTLDAPFSTQATTWESVSHASDVVNSNAVGQILFVNFYGVDTVGPSDTGFARVDNIVVTSGLAPVIPEPGTLVLMVAGLGFIAMLRRKGAIFTGMPFCSMP